MRMLFGLPLPSASIDFVISLCENPRQWNKLVSPLRSSEILPQKMEKFVDIQGLPLPASMRQSTIFHSLGPV